MIGYRSIVSKKISGAPYLPEFEVDFSAIEGSIFVVSVLTVVVLVAGLVAARKKNPYTSTIYVIVSLFCAIFMVYTAM